MEDISQGRTYQMATSSTSQTNATNRPPNPQALGISKVAIREMGHKGIEELEAFGETSTRIEGTGRSYWHQFPPGENDLREETRWPAWRLISLGRRHQPSYDLTETWWYGFFWVGGLRWSRMGFVDFPPAEESFIWYTQRVQIGLVKHSPRGRSMVSWDLSKLI